MGFFTTNDLILANLFPFSFIKVISFIIAYELIILLIPKKYFIIEKFNKPNRLLTLKANEYLHDFYKFN